jgi:hypothetical protein
VGERAEEALKRDVGRNAPRDIGTDVVGRNASEVNRERARRTTTAIIERTFTEDKAIFLFILLEIYVNDTEGGTTR